MKFLKSIVFFITLVLFSPHVTKAQTTFSSNKIGHVFNFSVPDYMSRATGINDAAIVQYQSVPKDVYTFVIEDSKEELGLVNMKFSSAQEFYDYFIKDFLADQKQRQVSKGKPSKVGDVNFVQSEASYLEESANLKIYYHITIAETPTHFYKILSYTSYDNKDKVKEDLGKMGTSIKEISCK